jgi:putative membrane protein
MPRYPPFFFALQAPARATSTPRTMSTVSIVLVTLVALLHVYFLVLEMFLWTKPAGRRAFGTTQEQAEQSKVLAANQGLYNGFLAAGLFWGIAMGEAGDPVKVFFLLCVAVAGVFGAATASRKILYIQTFPAIIALLGVWLS